MQVKKIVFPALIIGAALFFAFNSPFGNKEKESVIVHSVLDGLEKLHYQPEEIDDDFSKKVFNLYIDRLDGAKRWLTQDDVNMLSLFRDDIDDESKKGTYEFFDLSLKLLYKELDKTETYFKEFLSKPFDFSKEETIEMDGEKRDFTKNDEELKNRWYKLMKYETLTRLHEKLKEQKEGKNEELKGKSFEELEEQARKETLKVYKNWYVRLRKLKREERLSSYLNAITNTFDPHTGYFAPIAKQNFDINMSGKLEGIGARLRTKEDHTQIVSIVVGGPAWKGGELEEKDIILKVAQGDQEPVDITGMSINDVVQLIRGKKGTEVRLTVKKVDGSTKVISIIRDIVIMEEGFAKSLLLKTATDDKIGYIRLPRFYADFYDPNGRRCAADVAKEIEKLKKENVQGIILDLRNNGGGSLRDVVTMSGLFFEDGPVVQVRSRGGKVKVLDDTDSSVQYGGPLVVMVNEGSASASEILAAALQDYKRAVIIGTPTFGKGTVQRFLDLDRLVIGNSDIKPLGQIKLTTQKFYRVNGGSTQLKGVTPDIILPDAYEYFDIGEKDEDYPMKWDKINPVEAKQNVFRLDNLQSIVSKSEARVAGSEVFAKIEENAKWFKQKRDHSVYSLNFEEYSAEQEKNEKIADDYEKLMDKQVLTYVKNIAVDTVGFGIDESKKARNDDWLKNVKKDVYLEETLHVVDDLIGNK